MLQTLRAWLAVAASLRAVVGHTLVPDKQNNVSSSMVEKAASLLTSKYPFYHTGDQLRAEAERLVSSCIGADASMHKVSKGGVTMDVVTVRGKEASPINKLLMFFGEHARELISPESGLHFLKGLCGEAKIGADGRSVPQALLQSEFQLVLNSSPLSRKLVEQGDYLRRTTPTGVDPNRNWGFKWVNHTMHNERTLPGPYPFSEPETQILRDVMTQYNPTSFLSIHSGELGLYIPYAYDQEHMIENGASLLQIVKEVDASHCQCPFGAAGKENQHDCPGTSLDFAWSRNLAFAAAYEIFLDRKDALDRHEYQRWQKASASFLERHSEVAQPDFDKALQQPPSDFAQVSHSEEQLSEAERSLMRNNPLDKEVFDATVAKWADAYLQTAQLIAEDLMNKGKKAAAS